MFGHVSDRVSDLFFMFFKPFLCQIKNFEEQFRSAGVPPQYRAALKGTSLRGQTLICGFLRFLAKSVVFCGYLRFPNAWFSRKSENLQNLRESAKSAFGLGLPP